MAGVARIADVAGVARVAGWLLTGGRAVSSFVSKAALVTFPLLACSVSSVTTAADGSARPARNSRIL
jgi:hypothetical protein